MRTIPLVDLRAEYEWIREEVREQIDSVLESMELSLGENVFRLENEFAKYCRARAAIGVGSGTEALSLILKALDIGPGDEVITASHTFIATAEAIVLAGATPVFVDIDPTTYTIDPNKIEEAITEKTAAIMPVHLYGHPADMDAIRDIADRHGLRVIEDACQAHGSEYKGTKTGSLGDAAAFSFYCSKNLGAYGDGGMVVTNDRDIASAVRLLRNHGRASKDVHVVAGTTSRLDEIQAAILRVKLKHLERWNGMRRAWAAEYSRELAEEEEIQTPHERAYAYHTYHLYVVRTRRREALRSRLQKAGVSTGVHYPVPVHLQKPFMGYGGGEGSLPETETAAREVLSLPMYPALTVEQTRYVYQSIVDFFRTEKQRPQGQAATNVGGRR